MFGALTVTLHHRGATGARDEWNNPIVDTLSTETLTGCNLQQQSTDELRDERDAIVTTWVLFAPPPATMPDARARVVITAADARVPPDPVQPDPAPPAPVATFEIDGNPDALGHIDGTLHHLELILRRAEL